jgi:hypothetical protein
MGAYDNPDVNVGIDRQSGQMIGQAIAGIGQKIGGAITERAEKIAAAEKEVAERKRKEAEKARIRAEQNWRIHKQVESQRTQTVVDFDTMLEGQNIDIGSLDGSFKGVIDELYEAKDRLAQSRGDYAGRTDDEAVIRNNTAFINGLQNNFTSMNMLMDTWKEKFKLRDVPGGIDSSTSNPLFAAMMEIGEGGSQGIGAGKIGWETRTGPGGKKQLFQVARSEEIRKLNWINGGKKGNLEDASDTYELNYDQVRSFLDDDDNNPNTFGPFNLVPDDSAERKKDLQSGGVIGEDGKITQPDENGIGGFYAKGKETPTKDDFGIYMNQKSWPDTQKIQGQISTIAKSAAEADLSFGGSSVTANSNIRANALKREIKVNGTKATQYYIPIFGQRDSSGELPQMGETILGDSVNGIMSQGNEQGTEETDGYSKEEYEKYIKFTEWQYMSQAGAYAPAIDITPDKRDYSVTFPTGDGGDSSTLNKNETIIYDRLNKGDQGFADFFEENTTNKTGEMSEDGLTFTFKDENRKQQTIDMNDEQQVIGLFKMMLAQETGLGTAKAKDAAIFRLVEKYRKDKFGSSETNTGEGQGSLNNLGL